MTNLVVKHDILLLILQHELPPGPPELLDPGPEGGDLLAAQLPDHGGQDGAVLGQHRLQVQEGSHPQAEVRKRLTPPHGRAHGHTPEVDDGVVEGPHVGVQDDLLAGGGQVGDEGAELRVGLLAHALQHPLPGLLLPLQLQLELLQASHSEALHSRLHKLPERSHCWLHCDNGFN